MKLLVITQKVDSNDSILGFFHRWLEEFARHTDQLTVICLEKGISHLPSQVSLFSLGKENRLGRLTYAFRLFKIVWQKRNDYDVVFVHMNPIYVVLVGWLWRLLGKKIGFWYTHKHVDWKLRIAEQFAHVIFSASEKSFRLRSKKLNIMGHGIDTKVFAPLSKVDDLNGQEVGATFRVVSVGRLSPIKNLETLIDAVHILKNKSHKLLLEIVGGSETADQKEYENFLREKVLTMHLEHEVVFTGPLSQAETVPKVQHSDLFVNTSKTGSLDKAVLEAMSCGVPVLTSNEAFVSMLSAHGLMFEAGNAEELARMIESLLVDKNRRAELGIQLRKEIVEHHELGSLIVRILHHYETSR
jgi:glycosyltransferase involved in cell wall biosynthesis